MNRSKARLLPGTGVNFFLNCVMALAMVECVRGSNSSLGGPNIGERLFLETRFSEFFFTNSGGNANAGFTNRDPVMDYTVSPIYGNLPGPFAGQAMNCRACHLVEEQESTGNRTYCDFAQRSPIPNLNDGHTTTTRNAMPLVDALLPRGETPLFLHFDGQFATTEDLIIATLTGRNYGWTPSEYQTAIHHIASIIRNDNGTSGLAQQYGGWSYPQLFNGNLTYPQIESQYLIPHSNTMFVSITNTNSQYYVTDYQIVQNIASLMEQYLQTLVFSQDSTGAFNGSPFDLFLIRNGLPQQPDPNESPIQYSRRLLRLVIALSQPQWVTDGVDGEFVTNAHGQPFQFGSNELAGLIIFLTDNTSLDVATNQQQLGITTGIEVGNCATCHTPPAFSDFIFHNNGAAQEEYDALHGEGTFMALSVPGYSDRQSNYNAYLPPTTNHPFALGTFESPPATNNLNLVDLGLWNVFANPDFPAPQAGLQQIMPQLFSALQPQFTQAAGSDNQVILGGTNNTPGSTYLVLSSTNLSSPLAAWTVVATNTFDSQGYFSFTNTADPNVRERFYAIELDTLSLDAALPATIARFKTPTVRDLVSSEPYLHTGRMDTIESVLTFYQTFSAKARAGTVRNADPQLNGISLDGSAIAPLAAFLRALDEADYQDIPCPCQPGGQ